MAKKSKRNADLDIDINALLKKETIVDSELTSELSDAILHYAIEVITDRALPDVFDGLKPVQRRILWTGWVRKYLFNGPFVKCAKYTGDVMSDWHCHGDTSIYLALAALAQPWVNRYPLISFHGNVGNDIGDPPAHYRYCVTGDTLVNTNYGLIRIDEIPKVYQQHALMKNTNTNTYIDTNINTDADADADKTEQLIDIKVNSIAQVNSAKKWFNSDIHSIISIETSHGFKIKGTLNHPLLTVTMTTTEVTNEPVSNFQDYSFKWKMLQEINETDYVIINVDENQLSSTENLVTEAEAQFLGSISNKYSIRHKKNGGYWSFIVNHYNQDLHDLIYKQLEQFINELQVNSKLKTRTKKFRMPMYELSVNSKVLWKFLQEKYNLQFEQRQYTIPSVILQSSKDIQKIFLSYLFESTASIDIFNDKKLGKKCRILCASQSETFIKQLQVLLLQFGIISSTYMIKKNKTLYKLLINDYANLQKFQQKINFVSERNCNLLTQALAELAATGKNIVNDGYDSNFIFDKVATKRTEKDQRVFSIKVDSDCHSFTANGFINHNTEAKLNKLAEFNMQGVQNDAVPFKLNYSDTALEPVVLPGLVPNLFVNGVSGIAVGYHTNVPSHNLNEICNAIIAYINNNDITLEQLMKIIPAPDFPTGSLLVKNDEIKNLYKTGKGKLTFKAKYEVKDDKIIITELPPDVNREKLVEKLQQLCLIDKKIPRVAQVQDLSTSSTKIIITLQKVAVLDITIKALFSYTELVKNCSFVVRAVKNNTPCIFPLIDYIQCWVQHRQECIKRECSNILVKLNKKLHIQQGIALILNSLSIAIQLIEQAESDKQAKESLCEKFKIDEEQAEAILEFKLRRLTKLNKNDVLITIQNLQNEIADTTNLLNTPNLIDKKIIQQLTELKTKFGDSRRTQLINADDITEEIEESQEVLLILTNRNTIKVISVDAYNTILRSGVLKEKNEIYIKKIICNTSDVFILILENNNYVKLTFNDLLAWNSKVSIVNLYNFSAEEYKQQAAEEKQQYIVCVTQKGLILKINYTGFKARNKKLTPVFNNCEEIDKIIYSELIQSNANNVITLISAKGIINRFYEQSFKEIATANKKGLVAITLKEGDLVAAVNISSFNENDKLIMYTKHGDHFGYKSISNGLVAIKSRVNRGSSYIQFYAKDPGTVAKVVIASKNYFDIDSKGRLRIIDIARLTEGTKISRPEKIDYEPLVTNFKY